MEISFYVKLISIVQGVFHNLKQVDFESIDIGESMNDFRRGLCGFLLPAPKMDYFCKTRFDACAKSDFARGLDDYKLALIANLVFWDMCCKFIWGEVHLERKDIKKQK